MKTHRTATRQDVEEAVAEFLKHAPRQQGGVLHKVNKRIQVNTRLLFMPPKGGIIILNRQSVRHSVRKL